MSNFCGISQKTLHHHQSDSTLEFKCTNCANIANEDTTGALVSLTSNTPERDSLYQSSKKVTVAWPQITARYPSQP